MEHQEPVGICHIYVLQDETFDESTTTTTNNNNNNSFIRPVSSMNGDVT
jgi:hypothetical protein